MAKVIMAGDIPVTISRKAVKQLTLYVSGASGKARVSAPPFVRLAEIRLFVVSRLPWLISQLKKVEARKGALGPAMGMTHFVWGKPGRLVLHPGKGKTRFHLEDGTIKIYSKHDLDPGKLYRLLYAWYKQIVLDMGRPLMEKWRLALNIGQMECCCRWMKTRWGTCAPGRNKITLNAELGKRSPLFLDYVILHELCHMLVPNHGPDFAALLDRNLPDWRQIRRELNSSATCKPEGD